MYGFIKKFVKKMFCISDNKTSDKFANFNSKTSDGFSKSYNQTSDGFNETSNRFNNKTLSNEFNKKAFTSYIYIYIYHYISFTNSSSPSIS